MPRPTTAPKRVASRAGQETSPYLDAVRDYAARGARRLHVPGHKGGAAAGQRLADAFGGALALDVPASTRGIDIGERVTPLDMAQALAADAWGSARAWFLVNGASEANHAICLALRQRGDRVVVQRNVHSSAIHGLVLAGLRPSFVAPEFDAELGLAHTVTPAALAEALDQTPGATAAMVVSPTYYGAVADVRALADVCRTRDVTLVVDEAWGGHFPFHPRLPEHALSAGADLVVSGTHKTVGSLTQSGMLHLNFGADGELSGQVDRALGLLRSTSPSSLLLASLDAARRDAAIDGQELLERGIEAVGVARDAARTLPGVDVLDERLVGRAGVFDFDPLRLAIDVRATGVNGFSLADALHRRADLNLEMVTPHVLVAHFGLGDAVAEDAARLIDALGGVLEDRRTGGAEPEIVVGSQPPPGELVIDPCEAFFAQQASVPAREAVGRVAAESLVVYPPGIANVLPGERLTAANIEFLLRMIAAGGHLRGASCPSLRTVQVVGAKYAPVG